MSSRRRTSSVRAAAALAVALALESYVAGADGVPSEFAGRWWIVEDLGAPGIAALDDRGAKRLLDRTVVLADRSAVFADVECADASYTVERQSLDDYLEGFRLTRDQLHLPGERVETLNVRCPRGAFPIVSSLARGCVVAVWDGRFFRLARRRRSAEIGRHPCTK